MKKLLLTLALIVGLFYSAGAKPVSPKAASVAAYNFMSSGHNDFSYGNSYTSASPDFTAYTEKDPKIPSYYVFNGGDQRGFIIVSANDKCPPILGYSEKGTFDINNLPDGLKYMLDCYQTQIYSLEKSNNAITYDLEWNSMLTGKQIKPVQHGLQSVVTPMISSQWHQRGAYNSLCPIDYKYQYRAVAGCTAIGLSQLIRYWSYPETGRGYYSYFLPTFGLIYANLGATKYDWKSMGDLDNNYGGAAAELVFQVGVAEKMTFSTIESEAFFYLDEQPSSFLTLRDYFGYKDVVLHNRTDYKTNDWSAIVDNDLAVGHPVLFCGRSLAGGHVFICDGSDANGLYHFNWGWSGYGDGYYNLDLLNPQGGNVENGFNANLQMISKIYPPDESNSYKLKLSSGISVSSKTVPYKTAFTITAKITNNGSSDFSGDIAAEIIDSTGKIFSELHAKNIEIIKPGASFDFSESFNPETNKMLYPGVYKIILLQRKSTSDMLSRIISSQFQDFADLEVSNGSENFVSAQIVIPDGFDFFTDRPANVKVNLTNFGSAYFKGDVKLVILAVNGFKLLEFDNIESINFADEKSMQKSLQFSTKNIPLSTGCYYLGVYVKTMDGNWTLAGSYDHSKNPMTIFIKSWTYFADLYEDNNSEVNAYHLNYKCSTNFEDIELSNANINSSIDTDYYKIRLTSAWNYRAEITVNDSQYSELPYYYSGNVNFSYKTNDMDWTPDIDNKTQNPFFIPGPNEINIRIKADNLTSYGTYFLKVRIERVKLGAVEDTRADNNILSVYPNPTEDAFSITAPMQVNYFEIIGESGQKVAEINGNQTNFDLKGFSPGLYFVIAHTDGGVITAKIIKK